MEGPTQILKVQRAALALRFGLQRQPGTRLRWVPRHPWALGEEVMGLSNAVPIDRWPDRYVDRHTDR